MKQEEDKRLVCRRLILLLTAFKVTLLVKPSDPELSCIITSLEVG